MILFDCGSLTIVVGPRDEMCIAVSTHVEMVESAMTHLL